MMARRSWVTPRWATAALCLSAVGCVETNPQWDGPKDASVMRESDSEIPGASGDSDGSTGPGEDSSSAAATDDVGSDGAGTAGSGESGETTTSGSPVINCPGNQTVCDGVCRQVHRDARACGVECIDCTELFGDGALCRMGQCVEDE